MKQTFVIHKDLLVKHSEFFEAATNLKCAEGKKGVVLLEEDDPVTFEIFYNFLYTGK